MTTAHLAETLVLGLAAYGAHSAIAKDSLIEGFRTWAYEQAKRIADDPSYRAWLRLAVAKVEEGVFCPWCGVFWVGLAMVCALHGLWPWHLPLALWFQALAMRAVAVWLHKTIGPHKSDGETRVRILK